MLFIYIYIYIFFIYLKIYLLTLPVLGLCCCTWAVSGCGEQGLLFVVVHGLLIVMASLFCDSQSLECWLAQWFCCKDLLAPWHRGSYQTRDQIHVPCFGWWILNH